MRYFQKLLCLLILVLAASFGVGGCVLLYSDFSVQRSRMATANAAAHAQACTLLQTEILDLQRRGISTGDAALTARVTAQGVPAALWRGDTLVCATLEGLQNFPLGDAATVTVRTENSIYAVYASDLQGGLRLVTAYDLTGLYRDRNAALMRFLLLEAAVLAAASAVTALLAPETAKTLQVEVVDRLPGTNAALRARAEDGAPEGLVLIAQAQSAGRGRGGHSFFSPQGGLYLSILLRPEIGLRQAVRLTAMAAVAACRAAEKVSGAELRIKWVNDLWRDGRKVCGILTEAGTDMESGQLEWLVVGIGLNLTTSPADWPEELARTAGSLYPGGPAPVSRAVLAGAIARELLSLCPAFDCLDEYRARCFVPGHWVTVCTGAETYAAKALSIDDAGRLVVEREGGRQIALQHGEVSIRPTSTI